MTLNRTEAIDPAQVIRTIAYAHPVFTARGRGRPAPPRRDQRPPTARTTAAPTGAGASTRTASRARIARRRALGGDWHDRQRDLRGHDPPPPLRRCASTSSATDRAAPTSTSTSCRAARGRGALGRLVRFRRADYLGDPARRSPTRCARSSRAHRRAPARPDPPAHPAAHLRALLQPGQLLLLLRRGRASAWRPSSPRSPTRRGASATPTCCRAAATAACSTATPTRRCTSRRSWAWTSATTGASPSPARRCRCTSRPREDGERAFDATLNLRRRELAAAASRARCPAATLRVLALIYAHALAAQAQGRPRPPAPGGGA